MRRFVFVSQQGSKRKPGNWAGNNKTGGGDCRKNGLPSEFSRKGTQDKPLL